MWRGCYILRELSRLPGERLSCWKRQRLGGGANLCSKDDLVETVPSLYPHRTPKPGGVSAIYSRYLTAYPTERKSLEGFGFRAYLKAPSFPSPKDSTTQKGRGKGLGAGQRNSAVLSRYSSCIPHSSSHFRGNHKLSGAKAFASVLRLLHPMVFVVEFSFCDSCEL